MTNYQSLLNTQQQHLLKALSYLDYSYNKIQELPCHEKDFDPEVLETWESFTARFARVADLFLTKYLRTRVLENDPGFTGSLRDFVNQAEKLGLINDANQWMEIRELRNITAHEYTSEDLARFLEAVRNHAPKLLAIKELLPS